MKLRKYQENIIFETHNKLNTFNKILITLAMGGGKTVLISQLVDDFLKNGKKIVILTNISKLIYQIEEHLCAFNIDYSLIKSGNKSEIDFNSKVFLIMEQSFNDNHKDLFLQDIDILIKDEFHIGYNGKRYDDIEKFFNPNKIIGFSGTPLDENGYLLEGFKTEQLITYGNVKELTKLKYLVPLNLYIPKWSEKIDYSDVKLSGSDYNITELDKKINTSLHNNLVLKSMNELNAKNKNTLVYCSSISQADKLYKVLKEDGYKVAVCHSQNKQEDEDIFNDFGNDKQFKCIVSVSKLTTGFNKPESELLVLCRPTKILRLYLQIIYRVARPFEGKEFGEILDLSQCLSRFGFGAETFEFVEKPDSLTARRKTVTNNVKHKLNNNALKKNLTNEPMLIDENKLNLYLKQTRIGDLDIENTFTKDLITLFKNSVDLEIIVLIAFELNKRITKTDYEQEKIYTIIYDIYEHFKEKNEEVPLKEVKKYFQNIIKEKNSITKIDYGRI